MRHKQLLQCLFLSLESQSAYEQLQGRIGCEVLIDGALNLFFWTMCCPLLKLNGSIFLWTQSTAEKRESPDLFKHYRFQLDTTEQ